MGRFLLTREDIEKLEKNKYVAKASVYRYFLYN